MKIMMELLTDTLPGSGFGKAGLVDRDVSFDCFGLPTIPAKRVRGVLREASNEIEFLGLIPSGTTVELFGSPGKSEHSGLVIDDGRIEGWERIAKFLEYSATDTQLLTVLNPYSVLKHYSYTRSQTAVEDGTAKKNSLRVSRVLRRGLVFSFEVKCPESMVQQLTLACRAVRSIGASRNRGFGEVRLLKIPGVSIARKETREATTISSGCSVQTGSMTIDLETLSSILVSKEVGRMGSSEQYIAGSFILGALAGEYLRSSSPDPVEFRNLFLSGRVVFEPLYPKPKYSKKRYRPMPASIRRQINSGTLVDLAFMDDMPEDQLKQGPGGFTSSLSQASGLVFHHSPSMTAEHHHRRPDDRSYGRALSGESQQAAAVSDTGEFFQFEVLQSDQSFSGRILGPRDYLERIKKLMPFDGILRIGKSRVGQYGKCRLTIGAVEAIVQSPAFFLEPYGETVLRLASDTILLNKYGHPVPDPRLLVDAIAVRSGNDPDSLEIVSAFTECRFVGGYLGVWRLPRIQYPALAAGSSIRIINRSERRIDLNSIGYQGFGLRTEDGFGRIEWIDKEECEVKLNTETTAPPKLHGVPQEAVCLVTDILRRSFNDNLVRSGGQRKGKKLPGSFLARFSALIRTASSFDDLNRLLAGFRGKPAGSKLSQIGSSLFIHDFQVNQQGFEEHVSHCRPTSLMEPLRALGLEESVESLLPIEYEHYRKFAQAFLKAMKLKNRKEGGD